MMSRIEGLPAAELAIGMAVQARIDRQEDGEPILLFVPSLTLQHARAFQPSNLVRRNRLPPAPRDCQPPTPARYRRSCRGSLKTASECPACARGRARCRRGARSRWRRGARPPADRWSTGSASPGSGSAEGLHPFLGGACGDHIAQLAQHGLDILCPAGHRREHRIARPFRIADQRKEAAPLLVVVDHQSDVAVAGAIGPPVRRGNTRVFGRATRWFGDRAAQMLGHDEGSHSLEHRHFDFLALPLTWPSAFARKERGHDGISPGQPQRPCRPQRSRHNPARPRSAGPAAMQGPKPPARCRHRPGDPDEGPPRPKP